MFKALILAILSFLLSLGITLPDSLQVGKLPHGKEINLDDFELTWSDEFDGDELDRSKWGFSWWITARKGGYWHEDLVSVRDGNLIITAEYKDEALENYYSDAEEDQYKPGWYTGCITTRGKFEQCYGYYEVRCKLPAATGMWSAFWMMNEGVYNIDGFGQDGTEVDIFESMNYKDHWWGNDCVVTGIHYDGYGEDSKGDSIGRYMVENNPYEEFNTYGLEWTKDEYIFYINGVETGRLSTGGVSQNPEYLILSCEFAGEDGVAFADRHGVGSIDNTPDSNWPAEFVVDYVRVYQHK